MKSARKMQRMRTVSCTNPCYEGGLRAKGQRKNAIWFICCPILAVVQIGLEMTGPNLTEGEITKDPSTFRFYKRQLKRRKFYYCMVAIGSFLHTNQKTCKTEFFHWKNPSVYHQKHRLIDEISEEQRSLIEWILSQISVPFGKPAHEPKHCN